MKKIIFVLLIYLISSTVCYSAGYKGALPDIKGAFDYVRATPQTTKSIFNSLDESQNADYKKIPKEREKYEQSSYYGLRRSKPYR